MCKCEHKNILVSHYANEETNMRIGCRVRCTACGTYLFASKDKDCRLAYEYIEKNKDKFETLYDFTCDELNVIYGIKDGALKLEEE